MDNPALQPKRFQKKLNPLALLCLLLGLVSLLSLCLSIITSLSSRNILVTPVVVLAGVILALAGICAGWLAIRQIKKSTPRETGLAVAITGLVICLPGLLFQGALFYSQAVNIVLPEYKNTHPVNEAIPGLTGNWRDAESDFVYSIDWRGTGYSVTYVATGSIQNQNNVSRVDWSNNVLTWSYQDGDTLMTFQTKSLHGNRLDIHWTSATNGKTDSGSRTLTRVPWYLNTEPILPY